MNIDEYKYVVRVVFDDGIMYYNSGSYCLVANPLDATRYKDNDTKSVIEDKNYACCQGGESSIILFDDARVDYANGIGI